MVSRNLEFRILTNFLGNEIVLTKQQQLKRLTQIGKNSPQNLKFMI